MRAYCHYTNSLLFTETIDVDETWLYRGIQGDVNAKTWYDRRDDGGTLDRVFYLPLKSSERLNRTNVTVTAFGGGGLGKKREEETDQC